MVKSPKVGVDECAVSQSFQRAIKESNSVCIDDDRLLRIDDFVVSESGITRYKSLDMIPCNFVKSCVFLGIIGTGATSVIYKMLHVPSMTIVACKNIDLWKRDHVQDAGFWDPLLSQGTGGYAKGTRTQFCSTD